MAYDERLGFDPEFDYALAIEVLASQPITPENLDLMRKLYGERWAKIKSDPAAYGQYENDDVMRQAKIYMDKMPAAVQGPDLDGVYQKRSDAAARNLELATENNKRQFNYGVSQNQQEYDDIRRQLEIAYKINALGNAEALAAQGLGKGVSQMMSSGYGETAALSQLTNYANAVADAYAEQQRTNAEMYNNYMNNNYLAHSQYNQDINAIEESRGSDALNAHYADLDYMANAAAHNAGVSKDYYTNNLAEREFADNSKLNWANNARDWAAYNEAVRSNKANEALQKKKTDNDFYIDQGNLNVTKRRYGL